MDNRVINVAICDDEKYIVSELESLLIDIAKRKCIRLNIETYYDGIGLEKDIIKGEIFHIIFLDIEMQQNGIITAKKIYEQNKNMIVIFISNHEKYFRELFEVGAFRFLDKPIEQKKLEKYFWDALETLTKDEQFFVFQYNRSMNRVRIKDILYFESNKRKILIHKVDGNILEFYEKLNNVEKYLQSQKTLFLRTHQSFLINCDYILGWNMSRIILEGGMRIPISEDQHKKISFEYGKFIRKDLFNE